MVTFILASKEFWEKQENTTKHGWGIPKIAHHAQALEQLNQSLSGEKRFNEINLHSTAKEDPKKQEIDSEDG